jgi:hypothetical protein
MVPDKPISVLVCGEAASYDGRPPRLEHGGQVAATLAATLNSLDSVSSESGCQQIAGMDQGRFRLLFGYEDGPPANVQIAMGCKPGITNGLLQSDLEDPVRDQVTRLAPQGRRSRTG